MEKQQFLELFKEDDELRERKAVVLCEFIRSRRNKYTPREVKLIADTLWKARNPEEVEAIWFIASNPQAMISRPGDASGFWVRYSQSKLAADRKPQLIKAPGYKVMRLLKLVCSRKFVERELEQTHTDALHELFEAEQSGDKQLAQAIKWRLRVQLVAVASSGVLGWFLSKMRWRIGGKGE